MWYVHDDGDKLTMRQTEWIDTRGTWRYWRDIGDVHEWKSRGVGVVRFDMVTAVMAFIAAHRDRMHSAMQLLWTVSYAQGLAVGKRQCESRCPHAQPVRRPFIARLLSGRPFAAV